MSSIQAGDVVVCVNDSPCWDIPYPGAPFLIRKHQVLRVKFVERDDLGGLLGFGGHDTFAAERFRKVEKADDADFIAQIKACRPKRERVSS